MYLEGVKDIYSDVSFDKTYFLSIYTKYTLCSSQIIDNPTDKPPILQKSNNDSAELTFIVPNRGDFVKSIFLNMTLSGPNPYQPVNSNVIALTGACPYYMFHHFDLYISGVLVERLLPDMIHLELSLNHYDKQIENFKNFCGEFFQVSDSYATSKNRSFFLPLPFYFFKKFSLSPPLSGKYEVMIKATMKGLHNITVYNDETIDFFNPTVIDAMNNIKLEKISMPVEYFFVEPSLKKLFDERELIYTISQTQSIRKDIGVSNSTVVRSFFFNPVKELFFIVGDSNIYSESSQSSFKNQYLQHSNTEKTSGPGSLHHLNNLSITFDTLEYLPSNIGTYLFLNQIQTLNYHMNPLDPSTSKPSNYVYNYSFCLDPSGSQPTGSTNFSSIKDQLFTFNLFDYTKPRTIFIYAKSINILYLKDGKADLVFDNASFNNQTY